MDLATLIHVGSALVALAAAAVAVTVKKGKRPHIRAGYVFVVTMIIMALPGGVLSFQAGKLFDVVSCLFTGYMVLTGAFAFNPQFRSLLIALMFLGVVCIASYLSIEIHGLVSGNRATDAPKGAGYIFASIVGCALYGDIKVLKQGLYNRTAGLIRHLWRMNFAFFIATLNLFAVRPQFFPEWMQSSGLLMLLAFGPLLVMGYWRFKLMRKSRKKPSHTNHDPLGMEL